MFYGRFYDLFPAIAEQETRTFRVINDPDLPAGEYGLVELYCETPDCDCRRVIFNVVSRQAVQIVAVITYGWENEAFYRTWLGYDDAAMVRELKGPSLNIGSSQSLLAPALLKKVQYILQDSGYVHRLKQHYRLYKDALQNKAGEYGGVQNSEVSGPKIGRSDQCSCGSGKKYKKCCGKSG